MIATDPKAPMGGRLFEVSNHHTVSCGEPPFIDGDAAGKYFSYFVNEHGEQAVYAYDYESGAATLRMGDAGWETVHPVVNGEVDGLLMTKPELLWLRACWMATAELVSSPGPPDRARSSGRR
jgi:hypothetical protein